MNPARTRLHLGVYVLSTPRWLCTSMRGTGILIHAEDPDPDLDPDLDLDPDYSEKFLII